MWINRAAGAGSVSAGSGRYYYFAEYSNGSNLAEVLNAEDVVCFLARSGYAVATPPKALSRRVIWNHSGMNGLAVGTAYNSPFFDLGPDWQQFGRMDALFSFAADAPMSGGNVTLAGSDDGVAVNPGGGLIAQLGADGGANFSGLASGSGYVRRLQISARYVQFQLAAGWTGGPLSAAGNLLSLITYPN
jgi:hypothetical protein